MKKNFDELVELFDLSSSDVLNELKIYFQQAEELLSIFISQFSQSLVLIEQQIWKILNLNSQEYFNQPYCIEFFKIFADFNKKLIFNQNDIKDELKFTLLIPEKIEEIDEIFQQIEQINDDNHPMLMIVSLWFNNLSFLVHEYPRIGHLSIIIHINQSFARRILMTELFKRYLIQLQQTELISDIFTAKQLFYVKTCSFSLKEYFYACPQQFNYTYKQVLKHIGNDYVKLLEIHSHKIDSWSRELLTCITHLIGFIGAFIWWKGDKGTKIERLLPSESSQCDYIRTLIRIIDYQPFHKCLLTQCSNDETILVDSILLSLLHILETQNLNWFFRKLTHLQELLVKLVELSVYFRIYLSVYGILSRILTDDDLKELKITGDIKIYFYSILEQAWNDPLKTYKQIRLEYFLRGFLNLSKNETIQQNLVRFNKLPLFVEMCDQYPIVYDIIWTLSFNKDIQEQLCSNTTFISKLTHLNKVCTDEKIRKNIQGILWNLKIIQEDQLSSEINNARTFDIMISYSHKDKQLCKQIYAELIKAGYRVWIDFDQMRGDFMDAMVQAIESSQTIIICMSENYQKSNYCRAEAHYAFKRKRKIVPVLLQKHYRPDGWLLFLIAPLLYIDFNKLEFDRALEMLEKELKHGDIMENGTTTVERQNDTDREQRTKTVERSVSTSTSLVLPKNILEWTKTHVYSWLIDNNLPQMSRILANCDGASLIYLRTYMTNCSSQQILNLLQDDSVRQTKENLSLVELVCFQSLIEQQKQPNS